MFSSCRRAEESCACERRTKCKMIGAVIVYPWIQTLRHLALLPPSSIQAQILVSDRTNFLLPTILISHLISHLNLNHRRCKDLL